MDNVKGKVEYYLRRIKSGDSAAFDMLYDLCAKKIYYAAYSLLLDRDEACDVTQDTFVAVINNLDRIDLGNNAWSYMLTTAKNKSLHLIEKRRRLTSLELREEKGDSPLYEPDYDTPVLDAAKRVLTEDELTLVVMSSIEKYTLSEISQITGIPLTTVHWRHKKALEKVRKEYEKEARI